MPEAALPAEGWSRYNRLFTEARLGFFLYNALSNTLLTVDEPHFRLLEALRDAARGEGDAATHNDAAARLAADPAFARLLHESLVTAGPAQEREAHLQRRYARQASHFSTSAVGLTICPTLACNFRCPYCFEHSQTDGAVMSEQTQDRLVDFVRSHTDARRLGVSWYGGEPTLAWEVVRDLTRRFIDLGLSFSDAGLVTNGYLLDEAKIAELTDLRITSVQITLDGPRPVHDRRRILAGGEPTFARILANIDALLASPWQGRLSLRVNVDRDNRDQFAGLRDELLGRYDDRRLHVYAGHVHVGAAEPYGHEHAMDDRAWADFTLALYEKEMLLPQRGFHPQTSPGGCVANAHQGWVIGPAGELYKCWEDVGLPDRVVGDVHAEPPLTDPALRARYSVGTDPYDDPGCVACDVLPVCTGGCPNKRLRALQLGERGPEFCSPLKHRLEEYLLAYYDTVLTREICAAVLSPGRPLRDKRGWRVVSPAPPGPGDEPDPLAGPIPAAPAES